ncbi:MAG: pentapeptide repeat-containing protein, partial [Gemmatimonadaceae bacterium]|nr:pentapeptide repeat-containing protein [Gloeobacterales cyanobacterium ES-bin-141]
MTMFSPTSTRKRGVILTTVGWKKLQQAISTAEFKDNHGERYTFDRLGERTSLDPATIAKVLERQKAVDRRTLALFFQSFGLELDDDDHSQKRIVPTDRRQHWGQAVDVSVFYGRTAELAELENWVVEDRCRLVMLLGMGGIGKTTLSVKLAERVQDGFEHVIWRSLRNAPLLQDILVDLLECLSCDQHTSVPTTLDGKISRLTDHLRNQRCLVILDNVETVLCGNGSAGYYREGYEEYGAFFKGLAEVAHQSCLMLTSREKPAELGVLEGRTRPVRVYQLCGITEAEGQQILEAKDLTISESNPDWKVLIAHYSGNPLALQIVATMIRELLDSDIGAFVQLLRRGTIIFDDIRDLLEQQFRRLSEFEKEVVYWIAIEREGVELSILREDIAARVSDTRLWEALRSLGRRSLVVRSGIRFTLQPVLMEYASDRLVEQVSSEIINRKIALIDSHALIKAQAADDVREAQTRLLLKPLVDRLLATFGSRPAIERRLAELLSDLRRVPRQSGYAAGNLLNLLCHLKADLSGHDFSGLPIRQADLRDVSLHGVNFSHCHLERSAFIEAFGSTLSLAFSPDGSLLATGDIGGEIHLWRVRDGRQLTICRGHTDCVWSVAFSPDGKRLASGSMDQTARLWDTATGQCLKTLKGHANLIGSVAFSPDGRTLASGSRDTTVKLWDIATGQCGRTLSGHGGWVSSVSFSPDGQTLASGSADQTLCLWNSATGECRRTLSGHSSWVWSVAFSPDGRTLASGSQDG